MHEHVTCKTKCIMGSAQSKPISTQRAIERDIEKAWRKSQTWILKILKKLEETFEDQDWSEMREFGRKNREQSREILSEIRFGLHEEAYIEPSVNLDRWGVEEAVEVGVEKMLVDSWGIEKVSSNNSSDPRTEARSIHQVSRSYRGGRSFLNRSTRYQGALGIAIWKGLRSLTDSKVSRRYRGGVEPPFKTSFQEEKNTDMNAIQHATQPMIQSTQ